MSRNKNLRSAVGGTAGADSAGGVLGDTADTELDQHQETPVDAPADTQADDSLTGDETASLADDEATEAETKDLPPLLTNVGGLDLVTDDNTPVAAIAAHRDVANLRPSDLTVAELEAEIVRLGDPIRETRERDVIPLQELVAAKAAADVQYARDWGRLNEAKVRGAAKANDALERIRLVKIELAGRKK